VTLRGETEWTETVELGWNRLAPPDGSVDLAASIRSSIGAVGQTYVHPYGDGDAAAKIVEAIRKLCLRSRSLLEHAVQ